MKRLSIRLKITLWFAAALVVMVVMTYFMVIAVSDQVIQKSIRDTLITTVESNVDKVEFYSNLEGIDFDKDADQFVRYRGGYLLIEDDFLDSVNEVCTALHVSDGTMLYGENPIIMDTGGVAFANAQIQNVSANGVTYYVFDRELTKGGLEGLWLRGVVSENQGAAQRNDISRMSLVLLPLLVLAAVVGGYLIAGKMLRPIRRISDAASQITKGDDLGKRIEIGNGKDELHRLAGNFNDMFGRLEDSFQIERQFTADASHELRTPTAVILAQCDYALENAGDPEEYREALRVIRRQGRKMSGLINDMLAFTRLELRAESYAKTRLDLSGLVRSLCSDMKLIGRKGITLTEDIREHVFLSGNEELLSRLLTNLISNAYRYGKENGRIHVVLTATDQCTELRVEDDGIGIAEEEQEKIFRRFYRSDASRSEEGTGLGLSIAAEIARFHGGSLQVESRPGEGSVFRFIVPAETEEC